jgi:hypothetical protein
MQIHLPSSRMFAGSVRGRRGGRLAAELGGTSRSAMLMQNPPTCCKRHTARIGAAFLVFLGQAFGSGCGSGDTPGPGAGTADGNGGAATDAALAAVAGSLGSTCESDADCGGGLSCREDFQDYRAHRQCTEGCITDTDCSGAFGDAVCVDASFCAKACSTAADCPTGTICKPAGWCERSGPGSGVPYCLGSIAPCLGRDASECSITPGCFIDEACTGTSIGCNTRTVPCNNGCTWDIGFSECRGTRYPCASFTGDECSPTLNCFLEQDCLGEPMLTCADTPVSLCSNQPGCSIVTG